MVSVTVGLAGVPRVAGRVGLEGSKKYRWQGGCSSYGLPGLECIF